MASSDGCSGGRSRVRRRRRARGGGAAGPPPRPPPPTPGGGSLAPAAEHEAAEREAEPEGADGEAADRDRLAARSRAAASGRSPPAPRSSAARRGAACGARRRRGARGRGHRRSRRTRPSRNRVYSLRSAVPDACSPHLRPPCRDARGARGRPEPGRPDRAGRPGARDRERRPDAPRPAGAARARRRPSSAALGPPVLAVPGNHDIPYTFRRRGSRGRSPEFERHWETTEPVYRSDRRSWSSASTRCARGATSPAACARRSSSGRRLLAEAPAGALRVVALHHHLIGAPWRSRKRPVAAEPRARRARRRGRRADPRGPHPPGRRSASGTSSRS